MRRFYIKIVLLTQVCNSYDKANLSNNSRFFNFKLLIRKIYKIIKNNKMVYDIYGCQVKNKNM